VNTPFAIALVVQLETLLSVLMCDAPWTCLTVEIEQCKDAESLQSRKLNPAVDHTLHGEPEGLLRRVFDVTNLRTFLQEVAGDSNDGADELVVPLREPFDKFIAAATVEEGQRLALTAPLICLGDPLQRHVRG
jgi:hypothetical protein